MKALLRNLIIAGVLSLFAVQARAADTTVIWTFAGFSFDLLTNSHLVPITPAVPTSGDVNGTMTFEGNQLVGFNIVTTGTPFNFTYTPDNTVVYSPNDTTDYAGAWAFEGSDGSVDYTLVVSFIGVDADPSLGGSDPIAIDPQNSFEYSSGYTYSSNTNNLRELPSTGADRVNSDPDASPYIFATTVPEPASMALLGTGLLGLGAAVRRRSRANS